MNNLNTKEALDFIGAEVAGLRGLVNNLATVEVVRLANVIMPDDAHRRRLLAACHKESLAEAMADDYGLSSDAPEAAKLLSEILCTAAEMARRLAEIKRLGQGYMLVS